MHLYAFWYHLWGKLHTVNPVEMIMDIPTPSQGWGWLSLEEDGPQSQGQWNVPVESSLEHVFLWGECQSDSLACILPFSLAVPLTGCSPAELV